AARAHRAPRRGRPHQPDGRRAVDHRRALERHRRAAGRLHVRGAEEGLALVSLTPEAERMRRRLLNPWMFRAYLVWRLLPEKEKSKQLELTAKTVKARGIGCG